MEAAIKINTEKAALKIEEPIFRFAQINDMHVSVGDDPHHTREKFNSVLNDIESGAKAPRPDLLVVAGDLAFNSDLAGCDPIYGKVSDAIGFVAKQLKCLDGIDLLTLPGNHDFNPDVAETHQAWRENFGFDVRNYAIDHKGLLFILLDNSFADRARNDELRKRNLWFEKLLQQNSDQPKIIITHVPLVPLRQPKVLRESFGAENFCSLDPDRVLQKLIEQHRESVLAVLCGHLHLSGHVVANGVNYICASGTESWPCDYLSFEVFPDRLCGRLISADDAVCRKGNSKHSMRNGIHDRHAEGRLFTDDRHDTFDSYLRGNAAERSFEFPISREGRWQRENALIARKSSGLPSPNVRCVQINESRIYLENLSGNSIISLAPVPESVGTECYVQTDDGDKLYLNPVGQLLWQSDELSKGIPVEIPAWGSLSIIFGAHAPEYFEHEVQTAGLMDREFQLNNRI